MIFTRFSHLYRVTAIGIATALAASACGSSATSAPPTGSSPELTHLTVGALPITDDAPLFIAIKNGYFKRQGLTVTTKIIEQSTSAIPDMIAGSVDIIGSGNYVSFFDADAKGAVKVSVLAAASQCAGNSLNVLAMPKSGITGPASLAGKTLAVNLTNNIQTLTINAVLKANGVNPALVKYVEIPFPDMPAALKAGKVDAISEVEPFITSAEQTDGAKSVLAQCQGPTAGIPLSGYYATQAWVQKYPRTALAFQHAIEEAQAAADANRNLVEEVLPTYTKITSRIAALISLPDYPTALEPVQLQRVANLMFSGGLLKSPFNVKPILFHPADPPAGQGS
jgi:NitT/TauT family transport system substrate-binding protein